MPVNSSAGIQPVGQVGRCLTDTTGYSQTQVPVGYKTVKKSRSWAFWRR